jgi:hypothetical protein
MGQGDVNLDLCFAKGCAKNRHRAPLGGRFFFLQSRMEGSMADRNSF